MNERVQRGPQGDRGPSDKHPRGPGRERPEDRPKDAQRPQGRRAARDRVVPDDDPVARREAAD